MRVSWLLGADLIYVIARGASLGALSWTDLSARNVQDSLACRGLDALQHIGELRRSTVLHERQVCWTLYIPDFAYTKLAHGCTGGGGPLRTTLLPWQLVNVCYLWNQATIMLEDRR